MSEREQEIRERLEAATDGPWMYVRFRTRPAGRVKTRYSFRTEAKKNRYQPALPAPLFTVEQLHSDENYEPINPNDAEFIAHAPEDIDYLLTRLDECREALEDWEGDGDG